MANAADAGRFLTTTIIAETMEMLVTALSTGVTATTPWSERNQNSIDQPPSPYAGSECGVVEEIVEMPCVQNVEEIVEVQKAVNEMNDVLNQVRFDSKGVNNEVISVVPGRWDEYAPRKLKMGERVRLCFGSLTPNPTTRYAQVIRVGDGRFDGHYRIKHEDGSLDMRVKAQDCWPDTAG